MANEFGNVGAVTSSQRTAAKSIEVLNPTGAEWEVFYNGYWRDISSDYQWDTTSEGNTILRAIRWDDGFRSYREDRGLVLRKKGVDDKVYSVASPFVSSFLQTVGIGTALKGLTFVPGVIGKVAGFADKLYSPNSIGQGLAVQAAIQLSLGLIEGDSPSEILSRLAGGAAAAVGGFYGKKAVSALVPKINKYAPEIINIPGPKPTIAQALRNAEIPGRTILSYEAAVGKPLTKAEQVTQANISTLAHFMNREEENQSLKTLAGLSKSFAPVSTSALTSFQRKVYSGIF
jgi:hypothetical protein